MTTLAIKHALRDIISVKKIVAFTLKGSTIFLVWSMGYCAAQIVFLGTNSMPAVKNQFSVPKLDLVKDKLFGQSTLDYLIQQNIFDTEVLAILESEVIVEPTVDSVPKLSQEEFDKELKKYSLKGVILSFWGNNFAIIRNNPKNTEKFFTVGDTLFESELNIHRVKKNLVIIRHQTLEGELYLIPPEEKEKKEIDKQQGSVAVQAAKPVQPEIKKSSAETLVSNQGNVQEYVFQSTEIEAELKDFNGLLLKARVEPLKKNDEFVGYQIKKIEKDSIFERMGLQNGDIIKTVNGEFIDSPEKALSIFRVMRNETEFNLQLERKGSPFFLNYNIE